MDEKTSLKDAERTRHRLEILNQAFRGLLLINGGGALALLAYLQALEHKDPELSKIILIGLAFLVVGLVTAILFMALRYHTSYEDQRGNPNWEKYRRFVLIFLYGSLAFFVVAMGVLIIGSMCLM